jgi:hypothetical protein
MNVARILAKKQRFERAQNRGKAGSEKALTEAGDTLIGFYADKCPIEIPFYDRRLQAGYFQWFNLSISFCHYRVGSRSRAGSIPPPMIRTV